MKISTNALNILTKPSEGLRLIAYDDAQPNKKITHISQLIGTLTIGYGHTKGVTIGQKCNETEATAWLIQDIANAERGVVNHVKVPLTQSMFDALTDFVYNAGEGNLKKSSLLRLLNQSKYKEAAEEFLKWNKSGGKVFPGLTIRCQKRKELFLDGLGVNQYLTVDGITSKPVASSGILVKAIGLALLV